MAASLDDDIMATLLEVDNPMATASLARTRQVISKQETDTLKKKKKGGNGRFLFCLMQWLKGELKKRR